MSAEAFPIVEHRVLEPVRRGLLAGGRRNVAEIPRARPGSVFVFEADGRYELMHPRHLGGREEAVLDAVGVYVVDMTRDRRLTVTMDIPSRTATGDFRLEINFAVTVHDAIAVARHNVSDIGTQLQSHIANDPAIHDIGYSYDIDDVDHVVEVRRKARARVTAWCLRRPPQVPGVAVELSNIEVMTPADLRRHQGALRSEREREELKRARDRGDFSRATDFEDVALRGPEALTALAWARGETTAMAAADRAYEQRQDEIRILAEALQAFQRSGHLDRMNFDPGQLAEELSDRLTGSRRSLASRNGNAPSLPPGERRQRESSGSRHAHSGVRDDEVPSRPDEVAIDDDDDA